MSYGPTVGSTRKDGHGLAPLDGGTDAIYREDEARESLRCGRGYVMADFIVQRPNRTGLLGSARYCFDRSRAESK